MTAIDAHEVWYRADLIWYASVDECGDVVGSYARVVFSEWPVIRHTPRGVQLACGFVLGTAKRQHAVPTRELALRDLVARQRRHVRGAEARRQRAVRSLQLAEHTLALELRS